MYYYFITESFTYQREALSASLGIAGNLLLMISKNSSIAGSFKHHYCITFCFCVNGQPFFTVTFTDSKRAQMKNFHKCRTVQDIFQALFLVIDWMIKFSFLRSENFLDVDSNPYTSFSLVPSIHHTHSEARVRKYWI